MHLDYDTTKILNISYTVLISKKLYSFQRLGLSYHGQKENSIIAQS